MDTPPGFHPHDADPTRMLLPEQFYYKQDNTPILLVDTSYLSFYRFFSTQIWYHKLHPEANFDETYDWTTNIEFMNRFTQNYLSSVDRFRSRYNIPFSNVVFCRDCPRDKIWRMKIYPNYKSNRKLICRFMNRKFIVGPVFRNIYQTLIPQLEARHGFHVMKVDEAEADDIVAVMTRTIQSLDPQRWIFILTNDHDYLQLARPRVQIWSFQNRLLNRRMKAGAEEELEWKIWIGDTSDTIPSCWDNIPWNTILELCNRASRSEELENIFHKYPHMRASYMRNRQLIDFHSIPLPIQQKILYQATPFFMGSTAKALGWGWNGPETNTNPPPTILPNATVINSNSNSSSNSMLHIGSARRKNTNTKYHQQTSFQSQNRFVSGVLNRNGQISWIYPITEQQQQQQNQEESDDNEP